MGIMTWGSRYQLPNALPTEACEWEDAPAAAPPRERLHALLDDVAPPRSEAPVERKADAPASTVSPSAVRALLDQPSIAESAPADIPVTPVPHPAPAAEPLQFSLSCICLGGCWLSLHEGEISPLEQQLLANIMHAVGVLRGDKLEVTHFKWPPMANAFTPEEPLEEAREGVAAFIAGAVGRQGWQLERVLWWGAAENNEDSPLAQALAINQGQSHTLALPVWQGPSLEQLAQSAKAKRTLWPELVTLGEQWQTSRD
nr:hypothetical protein [Halomonas olivaria]